MVLYNQAYENTRPFWFHGFTYNATPGSRTQITDTIKNGYVFCLDPEASADAGTSDANLPSGMALRPPYAQVSNARYARNVTKPATGILPLVAGIVTNLPPEGLAAADYAGGGVWIDLIVESEAVLAYTHANMTYGVTLLGAANGDWGLVALAVGTNGANIPLVCGIPLVTVDTSSTAANKLISFKRPVGQF